MKNLRIAFFSVLICLPATLVIAVGAYLVAVNVPRSVRYEPSRIGREYRDVATDLIAHPENATYVGERKKGWRQTSRINGTSWGYVTQGAQTLVWVMTGKNTCRGVLVKTIRPFPYVAVFYWGGLVVVLVLVWLSALAVVCFVRFMRERDDFIAAVAHDLTTPLVGMRMMIGRDDDEAKRLNERMLLIVNNVKDFLRLGGRRKPPEARVFDILAACREAYALFAADYEDSDGGAVEFVVPGGDASLSPVCVCADETMTMQILWNLFGNDLKYAAPYGRVWVRLVRDGRRIAVEFADEGPGMTPRQMRKAFDRYYRAKTVLESGKGGFGIGLCASLEFARAMGGDLTVRANSPKGCVFTLTLPAA